MRDPGLRDRGIERQVGVVVIGALALIVAALFWVSGSPFTGPTITVHGMAGDVGQLTSGSPVSMRGVEVGSVQGVSLESGHVLVELRLAENAGVRTSTQGSILPIGFLGEYGVELTVPATGDLAVDGDTISLERRTDLMTLASTLGSEVEGVLQGMSTLLSDTTVTDLSIALSSMATVMTRLDSLISAETEAVGDLVTALEAAATQIGDMAGSEDLQQSLANIKELTARAGATLDNLDRASVSVAEIAEQISAGQGTLGRLTMEDGIYLGVEAVLENLRATSEETALLVRDIRERPDRYLQHVTVSIF